eukprot:SAG31_NODE_236_length_19594_cov_7.018620_10_plen_38_part_00
MCEFVWRDIKVHSLTVLCRWCRLLPGILEVLSEDRDL